MGKVWKKWKKSMKKELKGSWKEFKHSLRRGSCSSSSSSSSDRNCHGHHHHHHRPHHKPPHGITLHFGVSNGTPGVISQGHSNSHGQVHGSSFQPPSPPLSSPGPRPVIPEAVPVVQPNYHAPSAPVAVAEAVPILSWSGLLCTFGTLATSGLLF